MICLKEKREGGEKQHNTGAFERGGGFLVPCVPQYIDSGGPTLGRHQFTFNTKYPLHIASAFPIFINLRFLVHILISV